MGNRSRKHIEIITAGNDANYTEKGNCSLENTPGMIPAILEVHSFSYVPSSVTVNFEILPSRAVSPVLPDAYTIPHFPNRSLERGFLFTLPNEDT